MADFIPTPDRPCPLTGIADATPGHWLWTQWQARIDAVQGPPSPLRAENARRLAEAERILFGRVVTKPT